MRFTNEYKIISSSSNFTNLKTQAPPTINLNSHYPNNVMLNIFNYKIRLYISQITIQQPSTIFYPVRPIINLHFSNHEKSNFMDS